MGGGHSGRRCRGGLASYPIHSPCTGALSASRLSLMATEDLESIEATLELLSDHQAVAQVWAAEAAIAAGEATSGAEMAALMEERCRREGAVPDRDHSPAEQRHPCRLVMACGARS
jgi:hypothetical protein